ncbi:hypothetical protein I4U23_001950 [Adineta vaga]|nr:hypothetical protein I4U23_001950 [Adineta vaga]
MAAKRALCCICEKEKGGHREDLNNQLDEVEVTRDLFRQALTDKTTKLEQHELIEQVYEWETNDARQVLLKHITEHHIRLEDELRKLTNQIRQNREENNFFETDLNHWKEQLIEMKNKLNHPSNITTRRDVASFITKICIVIPDQQGDKIHNNSIYESNETTNNRDRKLSSSLEREHLTKYGNKDDQSYHFNDPENGNTRIPCEYCSKGIEWDKYERHIETCQDDAHRKLMEKRNCTDHELTTASNDTTSTTTFIMSRNKNVPCIFCKRLMSSAGILYHQYQSNLTANN